MKFFTCPHCAAQVFFDNLDCTCGGQLAYQPAKSEMVPAEATCANRKSIDCNWVCEAGQELCQSCTMTKTHPDTSVDGNLALWRRAEKAKSWVLANLRHLGWFRETDTGARPVFELLSEKTLQGPEQPVMGHADGTIVINVAEADPATLVERREQMREPYRTMIGHYRHEIAHFLFMRLSESEKFLQDFRTNFGDETTDYAAALQVYYETGAPADWQEHFVSEYASAHPHEDWAETAAHVLHLNDLCDSARASRLVVGETGFEMLSQDNLISDGLTLGIALNHLNRSMGLEDAYPFVISPNVREKLTFAAVHLKRGD